jgi:hypothetical protein
MTINIYLTRVGKLWVHKYVVPTKLAGVEVGHVNLHAIEDLQVSLLMRIGYELARGGVISTWAVVNTTKRMLKHSWNGNFP